MQGIACSGVKELLISTSGELVFNEALAVIPISCVILL
jgi:hypothetical protein